MTAVSTVSDALIVGEEFISEHYFTTEARSESFHKQVLDRRKEWDDERKAGNATARSRFTEQRAGLLSDFIALGESDDRHSVAALHTRLRAVLGFDDGLRWDSSPVGDAAAGNSPVTAVQARGLTGAAPLVLMEAWAGLDVADLLAKNEQTLLREFLPDAETATEPIVSVAAALSHLFVAEDGPQFALVFAGPLLLVTERERWLEGRYLAVDLQLVAERADDRRGGEVDRALTCVAAESLAPDTDGEIWWRGVLDESVKHTVGVSKDLREGVRLSIEIIANEVVARRRAQGLDPLPNEQAQVLAGQSLRFLYRILFLLYAEATPELAVLPSGDPHYDSGYSLDRLRELLPVEITTHRAQAGTHFYDSLHTLFRLVDAGHDGSIDPGTGEQPADAGAEGLVFESLQADLFRPEAIALIDEVKLGDGALQQVLRHLLMSKEQRGRDRGFISYAELGINQLGAVYEGLMSYTGFFASTLLYEVAKGGDAEKGSWVVPESRIEGIDPADFVMTTDPVTGEPVPVRHEPGSFVFRLAGRERQQSASYYTPEVLTRFTVGQALEELLDQDGHTTSAAEILELTVCEPALGSGAFAIEAVRQLAAEYLSRRQNELGVRIDPEDYPAELQKVKSHIALHQVYGVDLNATAVEFAEISLWLDTMGKGLQAPWFGLHLRRGNSLIGARRAVIPKAEVTATGWLDAIPQDVPLTEPLDAEHPLHGGIHHFLLPTSGWGATHKAKEAKELAPEALEQIKQWRKGLRKKPTAAQARRLQALAERTETLWGFARRRMQIAEQEIRRDIDVWGHDVEQTGGAVTRAQIESALADENGAFRRLRRVMDAWCALWFWPLTDRDRTVDGETIDPPSLEEWIEALEALLGVAPKAGKFEKYGQHNLFDVTDWDELGTAEETDRLLAQAQAPVKVLTTHLWLRVTENIAADQGFFHWELEFSPAFTVGGFDLLVGNPPWVRPTVDMDNLLAEDDPWFKLTSKPNQGLYSQKRAETLQNNSAKNIVIGELGNITSTTAFLGDSRTFPNLKGLQPDLYRCFMESAWRNQKTTGISALIHLETHFTEERAGILRSATYSRLLRHWGFVNELLLFEIQDQRTFGVNIYGRESATNFLNATNIYHPSTVSKSLLHDGTGPEPGIKNSNGAWDLRPHKSRIAIVDESTLEIWHDALEESSTPLAETRMVYAVTNSISRILSKISKSSRISSHQLHPSSGWHEKNARTAGRFDVSWGPTNDWSKVILQGPHIGVSNPLFKSPNETMKHQQDWSSVDLESVSPTYPVTTSYKPSGDIDKYNSQYTHWKVDKNNQIILTPARNYYRIAWRRRAANTGERTLFATIIPPGTSHIGSVNSAGSPEVPPVHLASIAGHLSSLVSDFAIRISPKNDILPSTINRLAISTTEEVNNSISLRLLRLTCLTQAYGELWKSSFSPSFRNDRWTGGFNHSCCTSLGEISSQWSTKTALRIDADRRQALLEIDALVALGLGITADELCTIYRTQFPVLYGYDRNRYLYDANGRLVPQEVLSVWRRKQDAITEEERTATNASGNTYVYELPFQFLDREADMRQAYDEFARRLDIDTTEFES